MNYKVNLIFSKKDFIYNLENYGKTYNLLFVTGLVGAGKSTISKEIARNKNVIILAEDWLTWSEVYKEDKFANKILNEFYKQCPRAEEVTKKNYWRAKKLSLEEDNELRSKYNEFLINYALKNENNLYIIEGKDIYRIISAEKIINNGIIVKGTSGLKCFFRRYKRDKNTDNQSNLKNKLMYLKMVIKQSKIYYFKDRKKLNELIDLIK